MNTVKILYFSVTGTEAANVVDAFDKIKNCSDVPIELFVRTPEDFHEDIEEAFGKLKELVLQSDIVLVNLHGGKGSFRFYDEILGIAKKKNIPIAFTDSPASFDLSLISDSTVPQEIYKKIYLYESYKGVDNFYNLFLLLYSFVSGKEICIEDPKRPLWDGIYYPGEAANITVEEFIANHWKENRVCLGLWFYQLHWATGNTAYIDAIIRESEKQGVNIMPVFLYTREDKDLGTKSPSDIIKKYFVKDGELFVDALINLTSFSYTTAEAEEIKYNHELVNPFLAMGCPVIKGICSFNTVLDWEKSMLGLNPLDIVMSVALPEFDGNLITVPISMRQCSSLDPLTGAKVMRFVPIQDRILKLVSLAANWGRLRRIPPGEKKIAIIFHNYPPRNDNIGSAFGLDSPESVYLIIKEEQKRGVYVEGLPESAQEMMEKLLSSLTSDKRWLSPEQMNSQAVDRISCDQYVRWFDKLPKLAKNKVVKTWGPPPGKTFVCDGKILIGGVVFGNVFVGIQPPRGFHDDPSSIYHSPDLPIPHHYIAFYRWIKHVFGAHLVMHIGKHGSLEWLPGKGVGLSSACYPDIAIDDIPNIYPYIINNPGEGTQAKRRSYACIIDHLIPVMTNADSYDEMAEIEVLLTDYYGAVVNADVGKLSYLQDMIWDKVVQGNYDDDLKITKEEAYEDFNGFLERLHAYIGELKDTIVQDGLHILGVPPAGEKLIDFLVSVTRLSNGSIPSLREVFCKVKGYNYDFLVENRGRLIKGQKTGGQIIESIHADCKRLIRRFMDFGFEKAAIDRLMYEFKLQGDKDIYRVLTYISDFVYPAVCATCGEIENTILASEGYFVPPGPSGAPTRGMVDILPTGRNFYSVDPRAIPSPAAWKVGVSMGNALLERYLSDTGRYPESIGMIMWGTGTMRTKGEDLAEFLYLIGVKPVWEERSGRVTGMEVIPLRELKRPRIDVTVRISGLFRDTFPNIVELMDSAIKMVAVLKETNGSNFLFEHVMADMQDGLCKGLSKEEAFDTATFRLFSCKPGTYGAGVAEAIQSKNWKDEKDLGEIYVTWGGYAYGKGNYGKPAFDAFRKRLSEVDMTIKNEDSREWDMISCDDFVSYHGGMIAAIKALKGSLPLSYSGDSSDPNRVRVRSTEEEAKHIFRVRVLNPKWIEGMKRHGYKGAGDISRTVDHAFGWDATAGIIEDWMYEAITKKYVLDEEMQNWFKEVNPYALQNIAERLLEAINRNMWNASEEMKQQLADIYLEMEGMIEEDVDRLDKDTL